MDVTAAASVSQQLANTQYSAQMLVLKKVLDIESQQGVDLARLVQQAAGLGRSADYQA
jgi:Putative motility protein